MRAAFRLWVTELRPKWIARWHGCAATHFANDDAAEEECVMLAELVAPLAAISPGKWIVANAPVNIVEERRPYVVHLRMLQEWLFCGPARKSGGSVLGSPPAGGISGQPGKDGANGKDGKDGKDGVNGKDGKDGANGKDGKDGQDATGDFVEHPAGLPRYTIVAAGIVKGDGTNRAPVYADLKAAVGPNGEYILNFKGYKPPDGKFQLIVKTLLVQPKDVAVLRSPIVMLRSFGPQGILLSIIEGGVQANPQIAQQVELMVEISRFETA
jgi:hypothetical protein